jgi:hypothetical protein
VEAAVRSAGLDTRSASGGESGKASSRRPELLLEARPGQTLRSIRDDACFRVKAFVVRHRPDARIGRQGSFKPPVGARPDTS